MIIYTVLLICLFGIALIAIAYWPIYKSEHFNNYFHFSRKHQEYNNLEQFDDYRQTFNLNNTNNDSDTYKYPQLRKRHSALNNSLPRANMFLPNGNNMWTELHNRNIIKKNDTPIQFCSDKTGTNRKCTEIRRSDSDISINLPNASNSFHILNNRNFLESNGDAIHRDSIQSKTGHLIIGNEKDVTNSGHHMVPYPTGGACKQNVFLTATDSNVILKNKNKTLMTISPTSEKICFGTEGTGEEYCLTASKIKKIKELSNQLGPNSSNPLKVNKLGIKVNLTGESADINQKHGLPTNSNHSELYSNKIRLNILPPESDKKVCYQKVNKYFSGGYAPPSRPGDVPWKTTGLKKAKDRCNKNPNCEAITEDRKGDGFSERKSDTLFPYGGTAVTSYVKVPCNRLTIQNETDYSAWNLASTKDGNFHIKPIVYKGLTIEPTIPEMKITDDKIQFSRSQQLGTAQIQAINGAYPVTIANVKCGPTSCENTKKPLSKSAFKAQTTSNKQYTYSGVMSHNSMTDDYDLQFANPGGDGDNSHFKTGYLFNEFYLAPWKEQEVENK